VTFAIKGKPKTIQFISWPVWIELNDPTGTGKP
jgi:hypothetical protein